MKKFNWLALPGVVVTTYFLYLGINMFIDNPLFACVWLIISGFGCYRSICVFIGKPISQTINSNHSEESETSVRLKELDSLYNQGLITRSEFEEKREKILNEL